MKELRLESEAQRESESQFNRSDILVGPPSRLELNGEDLLPTVGNAVIVVSANTCFVQVELAHNDLLTLRFLYPSILEWVGQDEDKDCLVIKDTGKPPARGWLVLEGPGTDNVVRQYSFPSVEVELNLQNRLGKDVISSQPVVFRVQSDDKGDWGLGNVYIPLIYFYPDILPPYSFRSDRGSP